jgi:hypothetical protein
MACRTVPAPRQDRAEFAREGKSAIAQPRAEKLAEIGGLRSEHRSPADRHSAHESEHDRRRRAGIDEPEERKGKGRGKQRAAEIDRASSDAVGKPREIRQCGNLEGVAEKDSREPHRARQMQRADDVGQAKNGKQGAESDAGAKRTNDPVTQPAAPSAKASIGGWESRRASSSAASRWNNA